MVSPGNGGRRLREVDVESAVELGHDRAQPQVWFAGNQGLQVIQHALEQPVSISRRFFGGATRRVVRGDLIEMREGPLEPQRECEQFGVAFVHG